LIQMNPENTDKKKINEVNFMVVDGLSIRKNTLGRVMANVGKLMSQEEDVEFLVVVGGEEDEKALKEFSKDKELKYESR
jgi:hypothetical protein